MTNPEAEIQPPKATSNIRNTMGCLLMVGVFTVPTGIGATIGYFHGANAENNHNADALNNSYAAENCLFVVEGLGKDASPMRMSKLSGAEQDLCQVSIGSAAVNEFVEDVNSSFEYSDNDLGGRWLKADIDPTVELPTSSALRDKIREYKADAKDFSFSKPGESMMLGGMIGVLSLVVWGIAAEKLCKRTVIKPNNTQPASV